MNKLGWSTRVVVKYALLQLPGLALLVLILTGIQRWGVDLPGWLFGLLVILWAAKDVVLFPFVWRAYDPDHACEWSSMIGARGVARDRLAPSGYVQVRGELWRAEVMKGAPPIDQGQEVRVLEMRGLTLIVQADGRGRERIERDWKS